MDRAKARRSAKRRSARRACRRLTGRGGRQPRHQRRDQRDRQPMASHGALQSIRVRVWPGAHGEPPAMGFQVVGELLADE